MLLRGRRTDMTEAIRYVSFEEYLDAERESATRHELVAGRVYARSGGSERHDLLAQEIFVRLRSGAADRGCTAFISNRLLRSSEFDSHYPDVMVRCGRRADEFFETSPGLLVEVLSRSTADDDRRRKATAYMRIDSLHQYVLVSQHDRRVEVAARDESSGEWSWIALGPGSVLFTPYGDIDIDELYDSVDAATTE